jgi:hypothetical protein
MNKSLQRALLLLFLVPIIVLAGWSGHRIFELSDFRAQIKKDYSVLNNITYGLLSVNAWRDHLIKVVTNRIDDFEFTKSQEDTLKFEISQVLHAVINKADNLVDKKQKTMKGKIAKFAVRTFVNEDKIHKQVPVFAQTIVDEIKKPANKEKIKALARDKLSEFGSITYDSANDIKRVHQILLTYNAADVQTFNLAAVQLLDELQQKTYSFTYILLGILLLFLALWYLLRNQRQLHTLLFVMSLILALVTLFVGLASPMIEIDARIKQMSFLLLGEQISFHDQVIFFQSKSIIEVVKVLIETHKFDSAFVGVLILIFSIIFPVAKLISTKIYLLGSEKMKNNKVINYFAFKSGKWSMADVNVVAIFMSYIGFKGILDSQMAMLNLETKSLASISTNETSLQPGFIVFVAFVLFGLILSEILRRISPGEDKKLAVI